MCGLGTFNYISLHYRTETVDSSQTEHVNGGRRLSLPAECVDVHRLGHVLLLVQVMRTAQFLAFLVFEQRGLYGETGYERTCQVVSSEFNVFTLQRY